MATSPSKSRTHNAWPEMTSERLHRDSTSLRCNSCTAARQHAATACWCFGRYVSVSPTMLTYQWASRPLDGRRSLP
jgi:hypothetical protein